MTVRTLSFLTLIALAGCATPERTTPQATAIVGTIDETAPVRYRVNDSHLHLVDFLQSTDGIESALAGALSEISECLQHLDFLPREFACHRLFDGMRHEPVIEGTLERPLTLGVR